MAPLERYSSNSRFEMLAAYSRAVADERMIHISGTVGTDPQTGEMPAAIEAQVDNIFAVLEATLAHFGAGFADVTRSRVYIVSADVLMPVAEGLRRHFADCPPANTTLICGIPAPGALVEIEVEARRPAA